MTAGQHGHLQALVALLVVQVIFGAFAVVGKIALREMEPLGLAAARVTAAAIVLLSLQRLVVGERVENTRDYLQMAGLALVGVVGNQVLFTLGLDLTTAINASVLITTIPVLTVLVAVLLGREPARLRKILGVLLSLAGVLVLLRVERLDLSADLIVGNLLVFLNAVSYSFFLVLSKPILRKYHPLTLAAWTFFFGVLVIVPLSVGGIGMTPWGSLSAVVWVAFAFIVLGPSVATYWLNNFALSRMESSTVALWIYLQPFVAVILAVLWLNEVITARTMVGALLIFVGVGVGTYKRRRGRIVATTTTA